MPKLVVEHDGLVGGGIVIGVDPAAHTGLVAVTVPPSLELEGCIIHASARMTFSESVKLTEVGRDLSLMTRVRTWMAQAAKSRGYVHVAYEEPVSAKTVWRGNAKQGTGTAFRLGAAYGLALAACEGLGAVRTAAYPPTTIRGRAGWMKGGKHEHTLWVCNVFWQASRDRSLVTDDPSEDELMAAGVVLHHLEVLRSERLNARRAAQGLHLHRG